MHFSKVNGLAHISNIIICVLDVVSFLGTSSVADSHLVSQARLNQPQCNRWFWLARLDSHHRVALYNSLSNLMFNFRGASHGPYTVASVPDSLLEGRREPGNIRGKSC